MARTAHPVTPPRDWQPKDGSLEPPTPLGQGRHFLVDGNIALCPLANDDSELLMMPPNYDERGDVGEDAAWRSNDDSSTQNCWKTTLIYQHIQPHPRLVRFILPDPWTWLPVVEKPSGPSLREFIDANRLQLYEQCSTMNRSTAAGRVRSIYRPLIYKWAIHLAIAFEVIHSYALEQPWPRISIAFGDLNVDSCWLSSPDLSLSLLGFLRSSFRTQSSALHIGDLSRHQAFQPQLNPKGKDYLPDPQTDIFLYGCVVYELMTGHWSGEGQDLSRQEQDALIASRQWPRLEDEYLGDVVWMCWTGETTSAVDLLTAVRRAVAENGAVLGDDEQVANVNLEGLMASDDAYALPPGWSEENVA